MKKAQLKELQNKLIGSVTDNTAALEYFSTDSSVLQVMPSAVVYPLNTADIRKTVQFAHEQSAAGRPVSLIPRGLGSNLSGGAIGEGVHVVLPAHMNKLVSLDREQVTVQPGISYRTLQQTLQTHGRFLPPAPSNVDYSTIGGAVSTNVSGERSVKYGATRSFVKRMKVVLADGTLIETRRITARELNRRKGLATLEGEIYRKLDNLLTDHAELIKKRQPHTVRNVAGYALDQVRGKGGTFDLGQVLIGAQGTLGIITEVSLKTAPYNPRTSLVVGQFNSLDNAGDAIHKLSALKPSTMEFVDEQLLGLVRSESPQDIADIIPDKLPKIMLFVEFDDTSQFGQKVKSTRAHRIIARHGGVSRESSDPVQQAALWKIRHSSLAYWMNNGSKVALPFIDDAAVPPAKLPQLIDKTHKLLRKHKLDGPIWGHAGEGIVHVMPKLDLSKKKDAEKLVDVSLEYSGLVVGLGGTPSAGFGDGIIRAPYLDLTYGEEMVELFATVKHIFDPLDVFNPGKKTQATDEYLRVHLRSQYSPRQYDHAMYT